MTMLFLPGTFVSAVFSMVFFDASSTSSLGVSVSSGAWLFPAITIPLTIAVFAVWNLWRIQRNKAHVHSLESHRDLRDDTGITPNDPIDTQTPVVSVPHPDKPSRRGSHELWTEKQSLRSAHPSPYLSPIPFSSDSLKNHPKDPRGHVEQIPGMGRCDDTGGPTSRRSNDFSSQSSVRSEHPREEEGRHISPSRSASLTGSKSGANRTSTPISWDAYPPDYITSRNPRSYSPGPISPPSVERRPTETTLVQTPPVRKHAEIPTLASSPDGQGSTPSTVGMCHPELQGAARTLDQREPFVDQLHLSHGISSWIKSERSSEP